MKWKDGLLFGTVVNEFSLQRVEDITERMLKAWRPALPCEVIVGYDTRFQADVAAKKISEVLASYGATIYFAKEAVPWGAVLHSLFARKASMGVMITGGDRPVEFNGIRFFQAPNRPLSLEEWERWSSFHEERPETVDFGVAVANEQIKLISLMDPYISFLRKAVDVDRIKKSDLTICFDPLYGGGQGIINRLFQTESRNIEELHQTRHSMFGGLIPSPQGGALHDLIEVIQSVPKHLGIAWDAEGMQWAWINRASGKRVEGHQVKGLIRDYVITKGIEVPDPIFEQDGILQSLLFVEMTVSPK